jgi:hypothetical protein
MNTEQECREVYRSALRLILSWPRPQIDPGPKPPEFIYFWGCDEGFIKIGASANPFNRYSRRRDQYKYGFTNMKLLLQVRVDDCFQYEAALHHKYTEYRIGNSDWFNFKIRPMGGSDE